MAAQLTPKGVTPRRSEWTVEKIAEKLRHLTEDLNYQHRMMTYRALQTSRQQIKEWRQLEGEDLFAGLKAESVPEEKGLTVRAKFKVGKFRTTRRFDPSIPQPRFFLISYCAI